MRQNVVNLKFYFAVFGGEILFTQPQGAAFTTHFPDKHLYLHKGWPKMRKFL